MDIKRRVNACLNKLTEKFRPPCPPPLWTWILATVRQLVVVVALVYDKAVTQSYLGDVYADMCESLHQKSKALQSRFLHIFEHRGVLLVISGWYREGADALRAIEAFDKSDGVVGAPMLADVVESSLEGVQIRGGPHAEEGKCMKQALRMTKFRRLLLNRCQDEFDNNEPYSQLMDEEQALMQAQKEAKSQGQSLSDEQALRLAVLNRKKREMKRRILGNSIFVRASLQSGHDPVSVLADSCIMNLCRRP